MRFIKYDNPNIIHGLNGEACHLTWRKPEVGELVMDTTIGAQSEVLELNDKFIILESRFGIGRRTYDAVKCYDPIGKWRMLYIRFTDWMKRNIIPSRLNQWITY